MKRLILTATAAISVTLLPFVCSANADSMGINKDCNHPVSQYGIDSITALAQYKAEPKKFMEAMTEFCNRGKIMGDMGFDAVANLSLTESKKWTDTNLQSQNKEQREFSSSFARLLASAMLNGFTGFDYPKPPEQNKVPLPDSFKPHEMCDAITSKAAEHSTSQLPSQVKISLSEWKKIKSEFEMVCLIGMGSGNSRKPVDNELMNGLNDIAKDVYIQAYNTGSKYPRYNALETSKASVDDLFDALAKEKNIPKGSGSSKSKQKPPSSPEERKHREEIKNEGERFQASLQSLLATRIGNQSRFSGKVCSVKIWLSQNGEVLSVKEESGDSELCSVILTTAKGMRLYPMSDEVYKMYRNVTVDIKP
ncbi:cell envelope integrity TolA C-terminal domain-containing protein [Serratia sp. ASV30]|uniref:cell envelope integrity TolA C-terminal domain-containing protein n=1 Tax=Serratia sp. ASV30 TaxID=2795127 RepID=UPI0018EDB2FC|nr:cell envelope integrity TolA C-terminal domain-containing protein [Serratia sp. ASV30]